MLREPPPGLCSPISVLCFHSRLPSVQLPVPSGLLLAKERGAVHEMSARLVRADRQTANLPHVPCTRWLVSNLPRSAFLLNSVRCRLAPPCLITERRSARLARPESELPSNPRNVPDHGFAVLVAGIKATRVSSSACRANLGPSRQARGATSANHARLATLLVSSLPVLDVTEQRLPV